MEVTTAAFMVDFPVMASSQSAMAGLPPEFSEAFNTVIHEDIGKAVEASRWLNGYNVSYGVSCPSLLLRSS